MYNVSQDYIDALTSPAQKYKLKLNIDGMEYPDSVVVGGSFTITNQCSEADIVQIGSVFCAELKMTVASGVIERNTWNGAVIEASEGMEVSEDTWEYVPLGVFTVAEANHTDEGVQIVAYDSMVKFDKTFGLSTTNGSPYSILRLLCNDCGVALGMTQAQVEALANGTQTISLYSENDCETYRDVLYWLAQTLATFATIGRDGKLYLREYTSTETMTLDDSMRFQGSSFSDFVTEYSGVGYTDTDSQKYNYVSDGQDDKLTYNLGANPFMQYGTDSVKRQMALNILNKLKVIAYVPFKTGYLNTPAYDLGDVIRNTDGIAVNSKCCIMWYEYNFATGYQVEGFGQNPTLATARNKVDKDISGLLSRTDKNTIQFYTFKNAEEVVVGDEQTKELIYIRFTTAESKQVTFQGEILVDADVDVDKLIGEITYRLDGAVITDYKPTETWSEDGKHIISLYYVIDVEPNTLYRWQVLLNSDGGTLTVPIESARGTIWGQGLVAVGTWDGYIDVEDTLSAISLDSIGVDTFTAEAECEIIVPHDIEVEDTIGAVNLDSIEVDTFGAIMYVNKTSLIDEQITWGQLKDNESWADVKDNHTW